MPYPEDELHATEELILDLHPHWWFFAKSAAMLALAVILAIATLSVSWLSWAKIPVAIFVFATLVWFMQRYIRWARSRKPVILPDAQAELVRSYVRLRRSDAQPGSQSCYRITVRQLESMVRLSEAFARLHCDDHVRVFHVREAVRLLRQSIIQVDTEDITCVYFSCGSGWHFCFICFCFALCTLTLSPTSFLSPTAAYATRRLRPRWRRPRRPRRRRLATKGWTATSTISMWRTTMTTASLQAAPAGPAAMPGRPAAAPAPALASPTTSMLRGL
jgi:hypothetical protein